MSLGGNFSSGYTSKLNSDAIRCSLPGLLGRAYNGSCCVKNDISGAQPVALYPSVLLSKKVCPSPTPAEFALYPKIAIPCSARTQSLQDITAKCAVLPDPSSRFARYNRYEPPVPCQPLPQSANTAGISLPSTRACNL